MSDREKRLLIMLLAAVFVVVNVGLYKKVYQTRESAADSKLVVAQAELSQAETLIETRDLYESEMTWLAKYEPKPSSVQQAQTKLQQLVQSYARGQGLTVKKTDLETSITDPVLNYHRVRIRVDVNGTESQLYPFLARLHSPNEFRAVTFMRVYPQKTDDTRIECEVLVEQWFLPAGTAQAPVASR